MLDVKLKPELVELAKTIVKYDGMPKLTGFRHQQNPCGCMGPQRGEFLCACNQGRMLEENLIEVVAEIDSEAARQIMLRRLVAVLPG